MKERRVVLAPEAGDDLTELYDWIGHLRSDVRPDLRIVGFERRLTVAFTVDEDTVTVLRVFTAGRRWESFL